MNIEQVREIAEAAFKARFPGIGIVVHVKPGFDHDDDPLMDVRIIYDAAYEDLSIEGTMSVQSEIIDKVWREAENSPGWSHIHFITKSDIDQRNAAAA